MNLALNEHLMSARCVKKAVTQDPYILLKYSSLFRLGTAMNCDVIWLDTSNIQWGEGIIHLQQMAWNTKWNSTTRSAEHALLILNWQFPQRLWKAYRYLSVFSYRPCNTSGPKSQKLLNSGLPTTCAADPNPARISATTKRLLPPKHKIKHDQDKQVQKAEEKIIFLKSKSADLTETPQQADLQNKAVLFLYAITSSNTARFLSERRERSCRTKGGKNHSNHLKKLSVQEILDKVRYVSVSYTEIQQHQPIKRLSAHLSIECSILVPGRKGKLCPCPRYSGMWFPLAGTTSCLCSALMISNCSWHVWGGCRWWRFKRQYILFLVPSQGSCSVRSEGHLKIVSNTYWNTHGSTSSPLIYLVCLQTHFNLAW